MKPSDLGFSPERFPDFRRYTGFDQLATAQELAAAPERFQILNAPTGCGKSLLNATVGRLRDARTLYLVGTKGLQSQLLADELVQRLVYGHRNYPCAARTGFGIEDADTDDPEYQCSMPRDRCQYLADVELARNSQSVVSNYAYWLSIAKYSDPNLLGEFELLVMDEAHSAPDWLTKAVAVSVSRYRLRRALELHVLPVIPQWPKLEQWREWVLAYLIKARQRASKLGRDERGERRRVERLIRDLETVALVCDTDTYASVRWQEPWTVTPSDNEVTFSPRWGSDFAEQYLFRNIPHVLLTSATVTEQHAAYLGIERDQMRYREIPSPFDPRRRPVIWVPTVRVDYRMSDGHKWKLHQRVDQIIEAAIDSGAGNGVIHTGSYDRTRELLRGSRYAAAIITHRQDSQDFARALQRFKECGAAGTFAVIASPRMPEGIDLPDQECRWQIILKAGSVDSRDPLTKLRLDDPRYRSLLIAEVVQQMCGRPMRSATDFATTYVLDDHWTYLRTDCPWPASFRVAFQVRKAEEGFGILTQAAVDRLPVLPAPRQVQLIST